MSEYSGFDKLLGVFKMIGQAKHYERKIAERQAMVPDTLEAKVAYLMRQDRSHHVALNLLTDAVDHQGALGEEPRRSEEPHEKTTSSFGRIFEAR